MVADRHGHRRGGSELAIERDFTRVEAHRVDDGPYREIGCRKFGDQSPRKAGFVDVIAELQPSEYPGEAHSRQRLSSAADHRAAPQDPLRDEDCGEPFGGYPVRVNEIDHQTAILSVGQIVALIGLP